MKRTGLQTETNIFKQPTCDPDSYLDHRVSKFNNERNYNRQLSSNFEIMYR